jgi:long-chain acyl-CoA synthetase
MISQSSKNKYALILSNEKITYKELDEKISIRSTELQDEKIVFLRAKSSSECVISILSAFSLKIPCVIFADDISQEQYNEKISLIKNSKINPKTALVLFTSGSSGDSKSVQISMDNINANTKAVINALDFDQIESQVLFLPLSYSYGLLGQLIPALKLGKTSYVVDHVIKVKKLVEDKLVQMISAVPSQHIVLLKLLNDTSSISHVISAGAPLNLSLREKLVEKFSTAVIYNNYGQTELSPRALFLKSTDEAFLSQATGRVVDGLIYKITEDGELLFKGDQVMLGYLNGNDNKIIDGWLYSGDLADEKEGIVYINGRKDSLIKIAGQRISLKFLERLIEKEEGASNCAAILKENELYGQELYLFYDGDIDELSVLDVFKKESGLKVVPKQITKLLDFPKNANGKKDYPALKKLYNL